MPFHVGGHKPQQAKASSLSIWAWLAGRLALTAGGILMMFFGYSRMEQGLHFGVDRYGGLFEPRGMMITGVLLALAAWIPDRLYETLARNTVERRLSKSKSNKP